MVARGRPCVSQAGRGGELPELLSSGRAPDLPCWAAAPGGCEEQDGPGGGLRTATDNRLCVYTTAFAT